MERMKDLADPWPLAPYEPSFSSLPALGAELEHCLRSFDQGHLSSGTLLPFAKDYREAWKSDPVVENGLRGAARAALPALDLLKKQLTGARHICGAQ